MAQQQELARFLTADGFFSDPDDNTPCLLYTDQRSSIFSWKWKGSDFGQKEFIVDGIRPNSSVACIFTNDELTVFCIAEDSSFRVVKYDDEEEDWLDVEGLPPSGVHPEGQVAGYIGLDGKPYTLFQDASGSLVSLDESWTQTILPVQATIGTPITNFTIGASGRNAQLVVFYLNEDKRLHYIEQGMDGKWGRDSVFAEVAFEDNLTKMIMTQNEKKRKLEACLLTANKGILRVREGGRKSFSLGKVGEDGNFSPGIQAASAFSPVAIPFNVLPPPYTPPLQKATGSKFAECFFNYPPVTGQSGPALVESIFPSKIQPRDGPQLPVCIIGAGVSGLYAAMMLDFLGIQYDLMEGSGRTGGRLYTHYFPKNPGKYQYFDVGAMRFPETTFMTRTFDLAKRRLGLTMLPYIRANDNAFLSFNGISITKAENKKKSIDKEDVFRVSAKNDGYISEDYFQQGVGVFWDKILGELRQYFVDYSFPVAFEKLKQWEDYSVTSYLLLIKKIPYPVIRWWETMESRTGLFDQSLVETILASLLFLDPNMMDSPVKWWCFDGGSESLHKAMTARIRTKPQHYMRVVAIKETDNGQTLTVSFDSNHNPRPSAQRRTEKKYSQVISTMSLGCLRMVDLDQLQMSHGQRNAIRELIYTPSIKIGFQFKTAWWEKLGIVGGQSSTDRPIRDIVYPSYGPDESHPGNQKSNCIIASYNGMQDSQRLGGLMKGRDTPQERIMLDLVMRDLAAVHNVDVEMLWDEFEDYHAWDFYRDEFQLGAFCQFGPNQFKYSYPYLIQPASVDQRFHFAGDATSTFHGWVAGALNSAWRAVLGMLIEHPELNPNPDDDIIAKFKNEWGASEEWDQRSLAKHAFLGQ